MSNLERTPDGWTFKSASDRDVLKSRVERCIARRSPRAKRMWAEGVTTQARLGKDRRLY